MLSVNQLNLAQIWSIVSWYQWLNPSITILYYHSGQTYDMYILSGRPFYLYVYCLGTEPLSSPICTHWATGTHVETQMAPTSDAWDEVCADGDQVRRSGTEIRYSHLPTSDAWDEVCVDGDEVQPPTSEAWDEVCVDGDQVQPPVCLPPEPWLCNCDIHLHIKQVLHQCWQWIKEDLNRVTSEWAD